MRIVAESAGDTVDDLRGLTACLRRGCGEGRASREVKYVLVLEARDEAVTAEEELLELVDCVKLLLL